MICSAGLSSLKGSVLSGTLRALVTIYDDNFATVAVFFGTRVGGRVRLTV